MRLTVTVLDFETRIRLLLSSAPAWSVWSDDRPGRRDPHRPTYIAHHPALGVTLAIYPRPRRLQPAETPTTRHTPGGAYPVVWHPALAAAITSWLHHPYGPPPGLLGEDHR